MWIVSGGLWYIDFAKAFDKVDCGVLPHKIKTFGKLGVGCITS